MKNIDKMLKSSDWIRSFGSNFKKIIESKLRKMKIHHQKSDNRIYFPFFLEKMSKQIDLLF